MEEFKITKKMENGSFYLLTFSIGALLFFLLAEIMRIIMLGVFEAKTPGFALEFLELLSQYKLNLFTDDMWLVLTSSMFFSNLILGILMIIFLKKIFIRDFKRFKEDLGHNIGGIFIGFVFLIVINLLMTNIYKLFGITGVSDNQATILLGFESKYAIFMYLGVLLAPLTEEIIFRQLFFGVIEEKFKWPWYLNVIISAAIFAALHDVSIFFIQYFLMGLVLCLGYSLFKKNIFVPIGIHFLNNAVPLLFVTIMNIIK